MTVCAALELPEIVKMGTMKFAIELHAATSTAWKTTRIAPLASTISSQSASFLLTNVPSWLTMTTLP